MAENFIQLLQQELTGLNQQIADLNLRREAVQNLLNAYHGRSAVRSGKVVTMPHRRPDELSTLDLAERILEKHGGLKADEIMEAIRQDFGIKPAHTLPQMLYIRARAKKRFFRDNNGRFGLVRGRKREKDKKAA